MISMATLARAIGMSLQMRAEDEREKREAEAQRIDNAQRRENAREERRLAEMAQMIIRQTKNR